MDADSLRQITDAIYYVASAVKIAAIGIIITIGFIGLMILIDTTRMVTYLEKLKEGK